MPNSAVIAAISIAVFIQLNISVGSFVRKCGASGTNRGSA